MTAADLCIADLTADVLRLEDAHVSALAEAATYRLWYLMTLKMLQEERTRAETLQRRLHQAMGHVEAWESTRENALGGADPGE